MWSKGHGDVVFLLHDETDKVKNRNVLSSSIRLMEENLQHDSSPQSDPGSSASSVLKMVQWGRTPTANVETVGSSPGST
ncbi:hypothetical protein GBF38_016103 [Nibea albiflora]|uniref:Uncharacterized protein n=1 Tax=Nibea albiflora TaxID=240163 RepID=A0ACB7FI91_NIBAL|nr:hypothetical protein GBF38_016103 [Nibea albiflora]